MSRKPPTLVDCSAPGRADCFQVHAWQDGVRYVLGPFSTAQEAQAAVSILAAKSLQLDRAADWDSGLAGIEPAWREFISVTPWETLLEELGGAAVIDHVPPGPQRSHSSADRRSLPPSQQQQRPAAACQQQQRQQQQQQDGLDRWLPPPPPQQQQPVTKLQQHQHQQLQQLPEFLKCEKDQQQPQLAQALAPAPPLPDGAAPAGQAGTLSAGQAAADNGQGAAAAASQPSAGEAQQASSVPQPHGDVVGTDACDLGHSALQRARRSDYNRDRHFGVSFQGKGKLLLTTHTRWGCVRLFDIPSAELGAKLHDTVVIWRTLRQEAVCLGRNGRPKPDCMLPTLLPHQLPATMNFQPQLYLGDQGLMEFLRSCSFAELVERLRREAFGSAEQPSTRSRRTAAAAAPPPAAAAAAACGVAGNAVTQPGHGFIGVRPSGTPGTFATFLYYERADSRLGNFGSAEEAAGVHDLAILWRKMQGKGRAWCDWNFPQLELAADQDLVEQLKGVDTLAGLEDFIDTWALDKLPALLQKHGLSCSESPARGEAEAAAAAAVERQPGADHQRSPPQQQLRGPANAARAEPSKMQPAMPSRPNWASCEGRKAVAQEPAKPGTRLENGSKPGSEARAALASGSAAAGGKAGLILADAQATPNLQAQEPVQQAKVETQIGSGAMPWPGGKAHGRPGRRRRASERGEAPAPATGSPAKRARKGASSSSSSGSEGTNGKQQQPGEEQPPAPTVLVMRSLPRQQAGRAAGSQLLSAAAAALSPLAGQPLIPPTTAMTGPVTAAAAVPMAAACPVHQQAQQCAQEEEQQQPSSPAPTVVVPTNPAEEEQEQQPQLQQQQQRQPGQLQGVAAPLVGLATPPQRAEAQPTAPSSAPSTQQQRQVEWQPQQQPQQQQLWEAEPQPQQAQPQQQEPSLDEMLNRLQPLLESSWVAPDLLYDLELGFLAMPGSRQQWVFRSLVRAAGLGDRGKVERLIKSLLAK